MSLLKSLYFKFPFIPTLTGIFLAFFLVSCGQNGDQQTRISAGTENNFSSPIPAQLEKARPGLTAKVVVDGGTANARTIDLQIVNDQVQGTIPDLPVGPHTFEIQYFIDGVLVATATVNATIQAGTDTPVPFDSTQFVFPDSDADGASNLNEVEIFGSGSNAWNDATTKPQVSVILNPDKAILPVNGVQTFTAAIAQNANQGVTWSVDRGDANGTITQGGTYTAPGTPGIYNVIATSQADSTKSTTIPVTVVNPGSLDLGFGTNGFINTTTFGTASISRAVAVQADGKIIAAGNVVTPPNNFSITRYRADGNLDTDFGTGGTATAVTADWSSSFGFAVAIQPDGMIVIAGQATLTAAPVQTHFALARFKPDGTLDTSFGTNGMVAIRIGTSSFANALILQPDGKIIAGGQSNFSGSPQFTVVRYNSNGTLDAPPASSTAFGTNGVATTNIGTSSVVNALALQPDGKIVAAGQSNNTFVLTRYEANGSIDTSFGTDGIVTPALTANSVARAVFIQPDGKIIATGQSNVAGQSHFTLTRRLVDGSPDTSFGTNGNVGTIIGTTSNAQSLALQPDGKIIVAGQSNLNPSGQHVTLARYNTDGNLDKTFDGDGIASTVFGTSTNSSAQGLAIQNDGKVITAGQSNLSGFHITLARFQTAAPPVLLRATLSGSEEVPAVTTLATGSATFVINPGQTEISYTLHVADSGISGIRAVQIHFGDRGEEGSPIFTLTSDSFVSPLTGRLTAKDLERVAASDEINTFADAIKAMRDGNTYIHVHTSTHVGGEIRGQIIQAPPTLSQLQAEIFTPRCAFCHNPDDVGSDETGLDLNTLQLSFNNLVNVPSTQDSRFKRVEPFKPEESYLIQKLEGTANPPGGQNTRMPRGGPFLSDDEIQKVRDWILAGAKND